MESSSPDYQGYNSGGNSEIFGLTQIFMYISILCWLLLLITGWICFAVPDIDKTLVVWNYAIVRDKDFFFFPLLIHYVLFYMIFIPTLLFITAAFVVYLYHLFIKKDGNVINGMLGNLTKFHFIPVVCVSFLFIIGESINDSFDIKGAHIFFNIFFSVIALASLIYIYMQTKIESPIYANWIIKHGAYACLIAFLIHNTFYSFWLYGYHLKSNKGKDPHDWNKGCYITFSIFIGLANLGLSVFLKEIVIAIMNLLMYIGMAADFYKLNKDERRHDYSEAPGIFDIFMILISIAAIAFIFIKYRAQIIA